MRTDCIGNAQNTVRSGPTLVRKLARQIGRLYESLQGRQAGGDEGWHVVAESACWRVAAPSARRVASLWDCARKTPPGGCCHREAQSVFAFGYDAIKRAIGFEPTTSSLGSWHSTTELRPRGRRSGRLAIPETSIGGRDGQAFLAAK